MRANRRGSSTISSWCAANSGAILRCTSCSVGLVLALLRLEKIVSARSSVWPARSIATIVLSNVGLSGLAAIASISLRCSAMPCRSAGRKSSSWIWSKRGKCKSSVLGTSSALAGGAPAAWTAPMSAGREQATSRWRRVLDEGCMSGLVRGADGAGGSGFPRASGATGRQVYRVTVARHAGRRRSCDEARNPGCEGPSPQFEVGASSDSRPSR